MRTFIFVFFLASTANADISPRVLAGNMANGFSSQGNIIETSAPFDFAISGEGWIPLRARDGSIVFTRYATFGMDDGGFVIHRPSGLRLLARVDGHALSTINLLGVTERPFARQAGRVSHVISIVFTETGALDALYNDGEVATIARVELAAFENQRGLQLLSRTTHLFAAPSAVGEMGYASPEVNPIGKISPRSIEQVPPNRYDRVID